MKRQRQSQNQDKILEAGQRQRQSQTGAVGLDERFQVENGRKKASDIALKVGIAGAIAFGALASGFLMSRRGRRLIRDVWLERRPSPLEDRVMDVIWAEPVLGRRPVDVAELEPGVIALLGKVRTRDEQQRLIQLVERVKGVSLVEDRLEIRLRAR